MRPAVVPWVFAIVASIGLCGCNNSEQPKPAAARRPLDEELKGKYSTPQEREYALLAYQFAKALQSGDYETAYKLGSSHLQSRMTVEELERQETQSKREFGIPLLIYSDPIVDQDAEDLAGPVRAAPGPDAVQSNIRSMKAMRAVGEIPATVPVSIRKASVRVEIERDPATIPEFATRTGIDPQELTEEDRVVSYLTIVIIEESRTLGVAYYFHRLPDIWDEELTPGMRSAEEEPVHDGTRRN
jgi:hypothetical protein